MKKIADILKELRADEDFSKSDNFVSDGLIDSADLQRLIALIEETYDIRLAGTDLMPQNFSSVESIRELLSNYGIKGDI